MQGSSRRINYIAQNMASVMQSRRSMSYESRRQRQLQERMFDPEAGYFAKYLRPSVATSGS